MMDWIEGFLKKHGRLQAFDDVWKALPPYPGFLVPKKAYREVTQWQGKEMRNLGVVFWEFSPWLFASQEVRKQYLSNVLSAGSGRSSTSI